MSKRKHSNEKRKSEIPNGKQAKRPKTNKTLHDIGEPETVCADTQQVQIQVQKYLQRTLEANKQMLYDVFGNLLSILEDYEARTNAYTQLPRSNIDLPDQSTKTLEDVKNIVQAQLLAFEMQSKVCPPEARDMTNKDLRRKTLIWAAVRDERNLPLHDTDTFICQLYEVIARGKTRPEIHDNPRQPDSIKTIRETISHMFKGKHDAAAVHAQFKYNPSKEASSPKIRPAFMDNSCELGAARLKRKRPMLSYALDEDLGDFVLYGPDYIN